MQITEATADVGILDGRMGMHADGDVTLYLETPSTPPLSKSETHATLHVEGDDYNAHVELDADALEALTDALESPWEDE